MSMKHLISRTRKAACTLAAAALALSCWPLSAFAADADVSYGDGSNTKVGIRLTAPQINVQAPVRITFGDAEAIDISTYTDGQGLTTDVKFINRTEKPVYLAAAEAVQTSTANIGNVFDTAKVNATNKPLLASQKYDVETNQTASMACSLTDALTSAPKSFTFDGPNDEVFAIAASSSGTEQSMTIELALSFPKGTLKSTTDLEAASRLKGNTTSICGIVWMFGLVDPLAGHGKGDTVADGGIFLRIKDDPVTRLLKYYAGRAYNLKEIKELSFKLGSGSYDTNSEVYLFFHALVTSMAPEGDYDCYVRYNDEDWPVRIIGLNQDVAASAFGNYAEGGTVGLTFQFRDLIANGPLRAGVSEADGISKGGWGGQYAQDMRNACNTNGTYYNGMGVKDSIVPVKKFFCPEYDQWTGSGSVTSVADKMFLASNFELTGDRDQYSYYEDIGRPVEWTWNEGTGKGHNEQYLFYQGKVTSATVDNYKWLAKSTTRDWPTSKVETASGGNASTNGVIWWTRSVSPLKSNQSFVLVRYTGSVILYQYCFRENGVCPCFCL